LGSCQVKSQQDLKVEVVNTKSYEGQLPTQVGQTIQATNQVITTIMLTKHKALVIIATTIKDELYPYVFDLDDPHAYWKKFQDYFETHNAA
jgi:hypothetical protein